MKTKSNRTEKIKIVFGFSLVLLISVIGGVELFKLIGDSIKEAIKDSLLLHFDAVLPNSNKAAFLLHRAYRTNIFEIVSLLLVFLFSFSFISRLVSDIVLIIGGARFGLLASAVCDLGIKRVGIGNSLCFWLLKGLVLVVLFNYICKITTMSLNSRHYSANNGRVLMKKRTLLSMLALTVYTTAATIILSGAYCFFLYAF